VARAPHRAVSPRPGLRPAVAVLLCLATLLAGCAVGPSQRPPVAVRGENLPAPPAPAPPAPPPPETLPVPQPQNARIPFVDCTDDTLSTLRLPVPPDRTLHVECSDLTVPADPSAPALGGVSVGVMRVGLAGAPTDLPPLLVLGDSAAESSARHAALVAEQVSPDLLQRYSLIGLDRRGAGTDVLGCSPPDARAALLDADPAATSPSDLADLLEQSRSIVQECNLSLDGALGIYRTTATAGDVELLRTALGVPQLSAIGVGDGAAALTTWADASPQSVGRLVLDGPPQPGLDEPARSEAQAAATEAAFDAFAVACTARPDCPLGADPRTAVRGLVTSLRSRPLAAVDGRRLTAGSATMALASELGEPPEWPGLAAALAAAGRGDPTPLLDLFDPIAGPRGRYDGMLATSCNDTRRRLSPDEIAGLATRWNTSYPLFGGSYAIGLVACAPWPTGGPLPATVSASGLPPLLVLGTAADPRGSLDGSRHAAQALPSARFLSWQGAGTGAYPRTACVRTVVDAMLIDGTVPQSGTLCPP
jgi:pimeloyl-ACP methyl ester carboxylesterase